MNSILTEEKSALVFNIFEKYHRTEFIFPDPLAVVRTFPLPADREIAALICASLALGRVSGIMNAAQSVVYRFEHLATDIPALSVNELYEMFSEFSYRFFGPSEIVWFLIGIGRVLEDFGSLENCFRSKLKRDHTTVLPALAEFVKELSLRSEKKHGMLLSDPEKGSAVKRLNLFLRWMVRCDAIDPGRWEGVPSSLLIYPMDTHMLRVARFLKISGRRQADLRTAIEVTAAFRDLDPGDPVRFDFSLTRPGINPALSAADEFF